MIHKHQDHGCISQNIYLIDTCSGQPKGNYVKGKVGSLNKKM